MYEAECYWAAFHPLLDAGYNSVGNDKVGRLNEICNFGVPICPIPQATQEEDNSEHCVPGNLVFKVYIYTTSVLIHLTKVTSGYGPGHESQTTP